MDFFEHQHRARRKTIQLILLFMLGIGATVALVNFLCFLVYWFYYEPSDIARSNNAIELSAVVQGLFSGEFQGVVAQSQNKVSSVWRDWWHSNLNWQVNLAVLSAISIGSLFRYFELAGGGQQIAAWAGAKPVDMASTEFKTKQFIHVCEEMAIAAGMPLPALYIMEREPGINAFVAGYRSDKAVLVITQGALETLSRDQLQGVIGHEYSHILNGDMVLNVRLMSFLAGLIMMGQMGMFLVRMSYTGVSTSVSGSRRERKGVPLVIIGAVLIVGGYVGVFVARLIKAAVSRQREYLADASSVQFTRNPDGLAGALYEIKEHNGGSKLNHAHAEDMSHFCFGESIALTERLATHPPINERIRRISPHFLSKERSRRRQTESASESVSRSRPDAFQTAVAASGFASMVGQVTPDHVSYAQNLYRHIPEQMKNWVHQSEGAKAFLYCQIMLGNVDQKQTVLNLVKQEDAAVLPVMKKVWPYCQRMDEQLRQPLLEMSMPALHYLSETDRLIFVDRLERMVKLDGRIDFVEWVTVTAVKLRLQVNKNADNSKLDSKLLNFEGDLHRLFGAIMTLSADSVAASKAYSDVCIQLGLTALRADELKSIDFTGLEQALLQLDSINFLWRKVILQACADIVQADGVIDFKEYEALKVVADCLASPLPVLILDHSLQESRDNLIPFE